MKKRSKTSSKPCKSISNSVPAAHGRVRRSVIKRTFTPSTVRKALPFLLQDFNHRCAYSLVHHHEESAGLEVEHFDPRAKKHPIQKYSNLMPAVRKCNSRKGDYWPTPEERRQGIRFIDPCVEQDYGFQIFEDSSTHKLVGTTSAARFQIRMLGLNDEFFVRQRRDRTRLRNLMAMPGIMHGLEPVEQVKQRVEQMIPPIPAPPPC